MPPTVPYGRTVTGHIYRSPLGGDRIGHVDEYPRRGLSLRDVDPGDVIGRHSEAAPTTAEVVASGPVGFLGVPAARAALRSVGRIHLDERHADTFDLVGDSRAELVERSGGLACSLAAGNRNLLADALGLFQYEAVPSPRTVPAAGKVYAVDEAEDFPQIAAEPVEGVHDGGVTGVRAGE